MINNFYYIWNVCNFYKFYHTLLKVANTVTIMKDKFLWEFQLVYIWKSRNCLQHSSVLAEIVGGLWIVNSWRSFKLQPQQPSATHAPDFFDHTMRTQSIHKQENAKPENLSYSKWGQRRLARERLTNNGWSFELFNKHTDALRLHTEGRFECAIFFFCMLWL